MNRVSARHKYVGGSFYNLKACAGLCYRVPVFFPSGFGDSGLRLSRRV